MQGIEGAGFNFPAHHAVSTSMSAFLRILAISVIAAIFSLPITACGDSGNGGDNPDNYLVPDYEGQKQKANDAADTAEQKQKEIEENLRQMEEGP
jgi:hypothetical protein